MSEYSRNQQQGTAQRVFKEIDRELADQWRAMTYGETSDELRDGAERMYRAISEDAQKVLAELEQPPMYTNDTRLDQRDDEVRERLKVILPRYFRRFGLDIGGNAEE